MAGAHGIDIALFKQHDVAQHLFFGHYLARNRVHFMTVDTTQAHRFAVDEKTSVFDVQSAESHLGFHLFNGVARGIDEFQVQRI